MGLSVDVAKDIAQWLAHFYGQKLAERKMNARLSMGSAVMWQFQGHSETGDRPMPVIMRRLSIICLMFSIFALSMGMLVQASPRAISRVHIGSSAPCYHPASPFCTPVH